jgi:hypothetical protein
MLVELAAQALPAMSAASAKPRMRAVFMVSISARFRKPL